MPVARLLASLLTSGDRLRQPRRSLLTGGLGRHYQPERGPMRQEASSTARIPSTSRANFETL
jgi:hypothetical protein